jgi:hypothetical protein
MLVGLDELILTVFKRSGVAEQLGEDNINPQIDELFGSLERAVTVAEAWIAGLSMDVMDSARPQSATDVQ